MQMLTRVLSNSRSFKFCHKRQGNVQLLEQYLLSRRYNSTKSNQQKKTAPKETKGSRDDSYEKNRAKGYLLLSLGALALGSTVASSLYTKGNPNPAIEPNIKTRADPKGKISIIFILGGPGSGKGTQSAKLVEKHGFVHLAAGDLLRAEQVREGSQYGDLIAKYIKDGNIVPQEITIELLRNAINEKYEKGNSKFLIDGFPRKMDQAITFEKEIAPSSFTLFFECPESIMLERLLERGKTSGRADDNVESIKKRFKTFVDTSMPVVDYFDKQNKVVKVRCDSPVNEVFEKVEDAINSRGI